MVSALNARTGFGKLLRRVEGEHRSLVIEKRGTPKAVLLSIRDYVALLPRNRKSLNSSGRNPSARARTSSLRARLTRSSRLPALKNRSEDDPASARHRHDIIVSAALKPDGLQRPFFCWRSPNRPVCTFPRPLLTNTAKCWRARS